MCPNSAQLCLIYQFFAHYCQARINKLMEQNFTLNKDCIPILTHYWQILQKDLYKPCNFCSEQ